MKKRLYLQFLICSLLMAMAAATSAAEPDSSLVLAWDFDRATASGIPNTVNQATFLANAQGGAFISGRSGKAFAWKKGQAGAIQTTGDFSSVTKQASLAAYVRLEEYPENTAFLMGIPGIFSLSIDPDGHLIGIGRKREWKTSTTLTTQRRIPLNQWVRVGITYDGQRLKMGLFINDVLDSETGIYLQYDTSLMTSTRDVFTVRDANSALSCAIEDVRFWNTAHIFAGQWAPAAVTTAQYIKYQNTLLLAWTPSPVPPPLPDAFLVTLTDTSSGGISRTTRYDGRQVHAGVLHSLKDVKEGVYRLKVESIGPKSARRTVIDRDFIYTQPDRSKVDFRSDHVMLNSGKPFFPLGIYHVTAPDLSLVADHGFNFVCAHGNDSVYYGPDQREKYVNAAAGLGLMTLMRGWNLLDAGYKPVGGRQIPLVETYRDCSSIIGWYTDDEPKSVKGLSERYDSGSKKDPAHPMFVASNTPSTFPIVAPAGDILAVDPYTYNIISSRMVWQWTVDARHAVRDRKPVWTILQLYTFTSNSPDQAPWNDLPSAAKIRAESYIALAAGARGLMYYALDDTWLKDGKMRGTHLSREYPEEWKSYRPVIQELRARESLWTAPWAGDLAVVSQSDQALVSERAYAWDNAFWILAVNPSGQQPADARIELKNQKISVVTEELAGKSVRLENAAIHDTLEPYGVRLYKVRR